MRIEGPELTSNLTTENYKTIDEILREYYLITRNRLSSKKKAELEEIIVKLKSYVE